MNAVSTARPALYLRYLRDPGTCIPRSMRRLHVVVRANRRGLMAVLSLTCWASEQENVNNQMGEMVSHQRGRLPAADRCGSIS
jgi:hypothetical protein